MTFLKEQIWVKENAESFEIFYFSKMKISALINFSADIC
jgi:hypothetical protein